jgi:hypothetical protein
MVWDAAWADIRRLEHTGKLIAEKRYPAMPVIIGNTAAETAQWADTAGPVTDETSYAAAIDKVFGTAARDRILRLYPASNYASPRAAFAQEARREQRPGQCRRHRGYRTCKSVAEHVRPKRGLPRQWRQRIRSD